MEWLRSRNFTPFHEQSVPAWDTPAHQAVLDIVFLNRSDVTEYVDVSLVAAATRTGATASQLIARREKAKHKRYPGDHLIPFVLDVRGQWGREATAWTKGLLSNLAPDDRAVATWHLRWCVAKALHMAVGEQILSSHHGVRSRFRHVSGPAGTLPRASDHSTQGAAPSTQRG